MGSTSIGSKGVTVNGNGKLDIGDYGIGYNMGANIGLSGIKLEGNANAHNAINFWQQGLYLHNFNIGFPFKSKQKLNESQTAILEGVFFEISLLLALVIALSVIGAFLLAPLIGATTGAVTSISGVVAILLMILSGSETAEAEDISCLN